MSSNEDTANGINIEQAIKELEDEGFTEVK